MLIQDSVLLPVVSWDNRWIAVCRTKRDSTGQAPREIAIYPRAGGSPVRTLPLPPAEFDWTPLRWTREAPRSGILNRMAASPTSGCSPWTAALRASLPIFKADA